MQKDNLKHEAPTDANNVLAEVNYSAVGTSLEPWIGWKFPVFKKSKNRVWVERDYGMKTVVKYDSGLFDFR